LYYGSLHALAKGKFKEMRKRNSDLLAGTSFHIQELQRDREMLCSSFLTAVKQASALPGQRAPGSQGEVRAQNGTEFCLPKWQEITEDEYVLGCVSGYRLEFENGPPIPRNASIQFSGTADQAAIITQEVEELVAKQAIIAINKSSDQFVSRLFVVPKKGNQWRAVLNLKPLNEFICKHHFKMENWWSLRTLLLPGDYMVRLDLKDAFLSIPIHRDFVKFLCFDWKGQRYAWQRLPFGLTSSPRVFTKVLKPVIAHLRKLGIKLFIYMDDILLWHAKVKILLEQLKVAIKLIQDVGLLINFEKSDLEPSQIMEFLGFKINLKEFRLCLTDKKMQDIVAILKDLRSKVSISGRELASILGKLSAASQAVLAAPLYFRRLQGIQGQLLKTHGYVDYDNKIDMQGQVASELDWWILHFQDIKPAPITYPKIVMTIFTDSSLRGWGAHSNGRSIQGRWDKESQKEHINYLELMAIKNGLWSFAKDLSNGTIQVYSDNSSAVAVLRKLGSIRSQRLNALALEIWEWAMEKSLIILALHIAGKSNTLADQASRVFLDRNSWRLGSEEFKAIEQRWGPHTVDMFADLFSHQLPEYVSWRPDPHSKAVDAFTQDWASWGNVYAFPPFGLISRVLHTIRAQKVEITLVFPWWPAQPWFPVLQEMMKGEPLRFTEHEKLLLDVQGEQHPLLPLSRLHLSACRVSGSQA
jgi:hypothetical protein